MRKLWTGDDVKKLVEDADYELIDVPNWDWVKSLDDIVVSCGEHEPYRVTRQSFKRGSRCRKCRTREARERHSLTHEEVVNRIKNMNIGLVVMKDSPIYVNNRTKLKLWCEKGEHYIFLSWEKIDAGRRCAKCSGIYNYSHSEIEEMVREIDNSYNVMKDSDRYENSVIKLKIYHEVCDSFFT